MFGGFCFKESAVDSRIGLIICFGPSRTPVPTSCYIYGTTKKVSLQQLSKNNE